MFNHIRHVPYVAGDGKGGIQYIVSGFSNQLGLETQIVAAMCEYSVIRYLMSGTGLMIHLCRRRYGFLRYQSSTQSAAKHQC